MTGNPRTETTTTAKPITNPATNACAELQSLLGEVSRENERLKAENETLRQLVHTLADHLNPAPTKEPPAPREDDRPGAP